MREDASGSRLATIAVVAVAAVLVVPAPVYGAGRERAQSAHDTDPSKAATANCPGGQVVIGAGGRIKGGDGGVILDAVIPRRTSVTVRGAAYPDHDSSWSVIAAAVCELESSGPGVTIESGTTTATCPNGTDLSGSGFDLPTGSVLTGLIPDPAVGDVTVRTPSIVIGGGGPTAYAVCVPELRPTYSTRFEADSPHDASAPKSVTAGGVSDTSYPHLSGVGATITWADHGPGLSPIRSDVFIDTLMPTADLTGVVVEAVDRTPPSGSPGGSERSGGAPAVGPDDGQWSVTGYGINAYYY